MLSGAVGRLGRSPWVSVFGPESTGKSTLVSDGMTDDFAPAFDPGGRWLYFISRRAVDLPAFAFEYSFPFARTDKLYAVALRDTVASLFGSS